MTREALRPGLVPVACEGGNFKTMTGDLGGVSCLSPLDVPVPEGGEAPDPQAAPAVPPEPVEPPVEAPAPPSGPVGGPVEAPAEPVF